MKIGIQFFVKRILTNFLAVFLVCLSIADGEVAEHDVIHPDYQVAEILYDYVDFPTSLVRNNTVSFSNLLRIADDNIAKIEFGTRAHKLLSDSKLKRITKTHLHPRITHMLKVVVCKNAP